MCSNGPLGRRGGSGHQRTVNHAKVACFRVPHLPPVCPSTPLALCSPPRKTYSALSAQTFATPLAKSLWVPSQHLAYLYDPTIDPRTTPHPVPALARRMAIPSQKAHEQRGSTCKHSTPIGAASQELVKRGFVGQPGLGLAWVVQEQVAMEER